MKRFAVALLAFALGAPPAPGADPVPAPPQRRPVAILGGTIHPVADGPLAGGVLMFEDGRITVLGREGAIPANAERVELGPAERVYPSFIALSTQLGLVEIPSVRATVDSSEVGELNPNVRAEVSVNPESELIPVARAGGVALAVAEPTGGLISGSSALLRLDGWTAEELVVKAPLGIHVRWPRMQVEAPGDAEGTERRRAERDRRIASLRELFGRARAYLRAREADRGSGSGPASDLRLESLRPVLERKIPLFLHADGEREIRSAVAFSSEEGLRAVVVGGRDAPRLAGWLRESGVPVIYGPIHDLPPGRAAAYDAPFTGPALLHQAGVRFAIADFQTSAVRNLPYQAATAAAFGLPPDEALKAITLYPAEILGVSDRLGSLAVGKSATLMVTDGDPLEITTRVTRLWIDGRAVDLGNRHRSLYEKYSRRLRPREGAERRY